MYIDILNVPILILLRHHIFSSAGRRQDGRIMQRFAWFLTLVIHLLKIFLQYFNNKLMKKNRGAYNRLNEI